MSDMRTVFIVLAPPGSVPTAMAHNVPVNQTLESMLQVMLALPATFQSQEDWGPLDAYLLCDLYGQEISPAILAQNVPFPGVVIAASKEGRVQLRGEMLEGEAAAAAVANSISMSLLAQREDKEDKVSTRYARFIQGGYWRFEATPITAVDVGLTYHTGNRRAAAQLLDLLEAKGLRCKVRVVRNDGSTSGPEAARSPSQDARALVVVMSQAHKDDPWIAHDIGAAWAEGIPVVPVLVGKWDKEPPNILAPYQRIIWDKQREKLVNELVAQLGLTPWSPADAVADQAPAE
jgi:hypothetical protein